MTHDVLKKLSETIAARARASGDTSYTRTLLDGGAERCARKLGEEAVETVIAGVSQDGGALTCEAADLLYHLMVLLEARDISFDDVLAELESRMGTSGLEEKASRGKER
ncbi:MAG: phosphoribosyl-ATP diphosphatase [Alphaproteobacteria bacterium]